MRKYKGIYKPKEKIKKDCAYCKIEFLGKPNKFYCSKDCLYKKNLERRNKRYVPRKLWELNKIKLKCKECTIEFTQKTPNQIFCNKECSREYFKKEHYKKYESLLRLRFEIFKRDNFQCQYCGRNPKEDKCKLVIDHIIPKSKRGLFIFENLTTSCEECNSGKSDILLEKRQLNKLEIKNE